ncbi:MAG: DUF4268 domain-containing protein [Treponema sp.]|nr:DUF4268 domain-containing protein [Treponema sp.]
MIGKIEKVPLREIWRHEAHDFTKWLQDNIDVLSDVINLPLTNVEREQTTGNFYVDLTAEDNSGNTVIIENQLEKSDHDHLGKIITYLSSMDATTAIWIVSDPRPEHVSAINWLNESTAANFYLLKIEGVKIGNSDPAPLLTLIVGPSEETENVGKSKREKKERYVLRKDFWTIVLNKLKDKTNLFNAVSPSESSWLGAGSGKRGIQYTMWVTQDDARLSLYIDRGKDSEEENQAILEKLELHKVEIESIYGDKFEWHKRDDERACQIIINVPNGGYKSDKEKLDSIGENLAECMTRFEKSFSKYIKDLKI